MKISESTITALQKIISGNPIDEGGVPLCGYRSGPELIKFFNQFGFNDQYGQGFPSRWEFVESKLNELNGTDKMTSVVEYALDPRHFIGTKFHCENAVSFINQYLEFDGYILTFIGKRYCVKKAGIETVKFQHAFTDAGRANIDFINEQIDKCRSKLESSDYDGAITNARSFLEAVLLETEDKVSGKCSKYDGDLLKLYKRVQKQLNLDPERKDISDTLKQVLRGLVSIIGGLAPIRNKMSDAHVREYRPQAHHAKLVINCSYSVTTFLLESLEYQVKKGKIIIKSANK